MSNHWEKPTGLSCLRRSSIMYTESQRIFTSLRSSSCGMWSTMRLPSSSFPVNQPRLFPSSINLRRPSLRWSEERKNWTTLRAPSGKHVWSCWCLWCLWSLSLTYHTLFTWLRSGHSTKYNQVPKDDQVLLKRKKRGQQVISSWLFFTHQGIRKTGNYLFVLFHTFCLLL